VLFITWYTELIFRVRVHTSLSPTRSIALPPVGFFVLKPLSDAVDLS
jgi:hypothetical protein